MAKSTSYADKIRRKLDRAVDRVVNEKVQYVKRPGVDFSRKSPLDMRRVIDLLLSMSGGSLKKELEKAGAPASDSAFCQARAKISAKAFRDVLQYFNRSCEDKKTFHGYQLYAVDGSCINMARNSKSASYVQSGNYNQLHLNTLYDLENYTFRDAVIQPQPRADEIGAMITMLKRGDFRKGKSLIVGDRAYCSYNLFQWFLTTPNVDFLCRVKQNKTAMREIAKLPMETLDTDVSMVITNSQRREDREKGYILVQKQSKKSKKQGENTHYSRWDFPSRTKLSFRVVRIRLENGEFETLATSLPRAITPEMIAQIYKKRWGVESSYNQLKHILNLTFLHGKRDEFVEQEIFSSMIMYNFTNRIARLVVIQKKRPTIYKYQINFVMAVFFCRAYFGQRNMSGEQLMEKIAQYTEPIRPDRSYERNIRAKGFSGFCYRVAA